MSIYKTKLKHCDGSIPSINKSPQVLQKSFKGGLASILGALLVVASGHPSHAQVVNKGKLSSTLSRGDGSQLTFTCQHLSSVPRGCSLTFQVDTSTGNPLYFDLERAYLKGGFEDRAWIFNSSEEESKGAVTGVVSLFVDKQLLASGEIISGTGKHYQMRSSDFLEAIQSGAEITMLVQADGRIRVYRLPYDKAMSECVKAGDVASDDVFDKMASEHGGRAICQYYGHLGRIKFSSESEYLKLLDSEISYLKGLTPQK